MQKCHMPLDPWVTSGCAPYSACVGQQLPALGIHAAVAARRFSKKEEKEVPEQIAWEGSMAGDLQDQTRQT